ncbi:MAG: radical SAM protein [Archaeoglobales archaeon]|nr:radical SAM protein [Archaeoglobales archaeon]
MVNLIYKTRSLCPECLKIVEAEVFEEDNQVMIKKSCPEHGEFSDVYWEDAEMFKKAMRFASEGKKVEPLTEFRECPFSCGICSNHKNHPALLNIVVTNRCDFACWYCFFYAERSGYVFEPSIEQIRSMVRIAKNLKPIGCNGVQLTGGEPALRDDLIEIIKAVKSEGIKHLQLNTNGIRLAKDPKFAEEVKKAGVDAIYLSFDGLDEKTNPKNYREIPNILENCRKAQLDLVLVPTIIRSVNDHQLGDMVRFAAKNIDIVRSLSVQPVSFIGKMSKKDLKKYRITIPGCIKAIEEQTNGEISREDFYPMPSSLPITQFVEAITGVPQYTFTCHFACGAVTTVFTEGDKLIPITRFVDAEGLLEYMAERAEVIKNSRFKKLRLFKSFLELRKFFDLSKAPKSFDVSKLLYKVLVEHSYFALYEWHRRSILLTMMHFQDLYNYDLARVERCLIHYGSPDGRIIPFCTYNVLSEIYRDRIQREFGVPLEEWERKHEPKELATLKISKN